MALVSYSRQRMPHRFHRKPGLFGLCEGLLFVDVLDVFD